MIIRAAADLWLKQGLKYKVSAYLAGADWHLAISAALVKHGLRLAHLRTLREVVMAFRGRCWWEPDPIWQVGDIVRPPVQLLDQGGDDCDGMAMLHAQAVEHALESAGWTARIVSYLADPWTMSHHFAAAIDPAGKVWAIQPQPARWQPQDIESIWGPFPDLKVAAHTIAASYGAGVVWFDVRTPMWEPIN